jgi:hypothetical protein
MLHLNVQKIDLNVAYMYTTSGTRQGWGAAETGTEVNGRGGGRSAVGDGSGAGTGHRE